MCFMKNMGFLGGLLKMIFGMNKFSSGDIEKGEKEFKCIEVMISFMIMEERKNFDLLVKFFSWCCCIV